MATKNIYIDRLVQIGDQIKNEHELRNAARVTILLAEPGAGKTALLKSLASHFGVQRIRASQFRYKTKFSDNPVLVIDGLDEVAKIDQTAVDQLIVKAEELNPTKVFFASRSGQWEQARTVAVQEAFASEPCLAHLKPLNPDEQRRLFEAYKPDQDYTFFQHSLMQLDIGSLLGNPQMLKIFADAFVRNGGIFETKRKVFDAALFQLASEHNSEIGQIDRPSTASFLDHGEQVFCKLLLSGASGIASTEQNADRDFPYVLNLLRQFAATSDVINTGLFSPADQIDQHEPVHRVIAEYAAARYLTRRINDPSDRLSLSRVMALIAPNNVVRDELRGLLAWMATEGSPSIETTVIDIDPYAVISNGDPSFLSAPSKSYLLTKLAEIAETNPHFRGSDVWREFSANGFFTEAVVADTEKILNDENASEELTSLLLELLKGTSVAIQLNEPLTNFMLDKKQGKYQRIRALRILLENDNFDYRKAFDTLLKEGSGLAMELAAELFENGYPHCLSLDQGSSLLHAIAENCFSKGPESYDQRTSRYFIRHLIGAFSSDNIPSLLDDLSKDLTCDCEQKERHDCYCRYGRSYLIGKLLDRFFELGNCEIKPDKIWQWLKNVRYPYGKSAKDSLAVSKLQSDDELRRAVHLLAFEKLKGHEEFWAMKVALQNEQGHSGLLFKWDDLKALTDFAFEQDNDELWSCFIEHHYPYKKENFHNPYRAHMRKQALDKPTFMRRWYLAQKSWKEHTAQSKHWSIRRSKRMRKHDQKQEEIRKQNQANFDANREQIEAGKHWNWLVFLAEKYLFGDTEHLPDMGDKGFLVRALCNSFSFLKPDIPSLEKIARNEKNFTIVMVAHAACLAYYRQHKTLAKIDRSILEAVKTEADVSYSGGDDTDITQFRDELEAQIWGTPDDVEDFAQRYIEVQISDPNRAHTNVGWLAYNPRFKSIGEKLAAEWLQKYPTMHLSSVGTLFNIAAGQSIPDWLDNYIDQRIAGVERPHNQNMSKDDRKEAIDFWRLRKFFVSDTPDKNTIKWLKDDKERLLEINAIAGRFNRQGNSGWSKLSSEKIAIILDVFIGLWPKVYLPSSYGTSDPPEQIAYRFLTDIVWSIGRDHPSKGLSVINRLLDDPRFVDMSQSLRHLKSDALKQLALEGFEPPSSEEVTRMLDNQQIASVEDMRALLIELFEEMQRWLDGAETDPITLFYDKQGDGTVVRKGENASTKIVSDRLKSRCEALGLNVTIELQQRDANRTDIGILSTISGEQALLVIEAKGQWHRDLFTAAAEQLDTRYSIHPNAARQGIYLVYWFGSETEVADVKKHGLKSSNELRDKILENMPVDLKARISVAVLDVSR